MSKNQEIDVSSQLKFLYDSRSPFTPEEKLQACGAYLVTGSSGKAAKYCENEKINAALIRNWKTRAPWWNQAMAMVKAEKQEELDTVLTSLLNKVPKEIRDRVENGDEVILKDGTRSRKKVSLRDLIGAMQYLYGTRALLRGDPTKISDAADTERLLDKIAKRLEQPTKGVLLEGEVVRDVTVSSR